MFLDVHAHLHVREFDKDRDEVIKRAKAQGVSKIINVGFDIEGNFQALALAKKSEKEEEWPEIFATFGIHPHLASEWNDEIGQKIYETAKREPKIVALGEMGLDFYKHATGNGALMSRSINNFQSKEIQKKAFEAQLSLAKELDLPVIIHCRDAFEELFKILQKRKMKRVLLHCFTGSIEIAEEAWRKGFYTSFTGIVTYPKAEELRRVVKEAPAALLFLETDCPFLAPQKYRGKRNEPAFVKEVYEKVADIKKIARSELVQKTIQNLKILFGV